VITSEANNGGQINDQMPIDGGISGYKIWLNEVTGYDIKMIPIMVMLEY